MQPNRKVIPMRSNQQPFQQMTPLSSIFKEVASEPMPEELCFICPNCGVIEPRQLPTGRWIQRTCDCQKATKKAAQQAAEEKQRIEDATRRCFGGWLGQRWVNDEVIAEMASKTFASYQRSRFPVAYDLARKFAQKPKGNVLFCGTFGTGKSHLESAICNYLIATTRMTCLFASAPQLFRAYNDAQRAFDQTQFIKMTEQMMSAGLLVIDDVDKARPTEARIDTYFLVLDERCKGRRPTILSTNKEDQLSEYIGEAVAYSRFMRGLNTIEMIGDDYRLYEE